MKFNRGITQSNIMALKYNGSKTSVADQSHPSYSISGLYGVTENRFSLPPETNKYLSKIISQWFVIKGISANEGQWLLRDRKK